MTTTEPAPPGEHGEAMQLAQYVVSGIGYLNSEILLAKAYIAQARELAEVRDQLKQMVRERDGEREARERCSDALRGKDAAMGELFRRLSVAGVDCSDLIS